MAMNDALLNPDHFAWLKNNIVELDSGTQFVKIRIPKDLYIDMDQLKGVFEMNLNAAFIRQGDKEYIAGNVIDPELFKLFMQISSTYSFKWVYQDSNIDFRQT